MLYQPPDKPDFIGHLYNSLKEVTFLILGMLPNRGFYLMSGNKMLFKKHHSDPFSHASPIVKNYINLCFSHSFHQLIMEPKRITEHAKTLIDHILANFPETVIQSGVIELGLSDHELFYCLRKTQFLKLNQHYKISSKSIRNYSDSK